MSRRINWRMFWIVVAIAAAALWLVFVYGPKANGASSDCPAAAYPEDC